MPEHSNPHLRKHKPQLPHLRPADLDDDQILEGLLALNLDSDRALQGSINELALHTVR